MTTEIYIILTIDVFLAILIGLYQKTRGYKFINSFIGALFGLLALSFMMYNGYKKAGY